MDFIKKEHKYLAKTFYGLEGVLAEELEAVGATNVEAISRAVMFTGDKKVMYKANLCTHTSLRILAHLFDGKAVSEDAIYKLAYRFPWENLFGIENSIAIDSVVKSETFTNTKMVTQKVREAITDRFRHASGRAPSIEFERPDYRVNIHIWDENVSFYMDSSCQPLFKRDYKVEKEENPLNEVLAAGMIKLSGWDGTQPFLDPMCGSGTLLAEALLITTKSAPGLFRKYYGFKNWSNFEYSIYKEIIEEVKANIKKPATKLYGYEASRKTISLAKRNIENIGFLDAVDFKVVPFKKVTPPVDNGVVIITPEHKEEEIENVEFAYETVNGVLISNFQGWDSWVLSSTKEAMRVIDQDPEYNLTLFNGSVGCWFNCYKF